MARLLLADENFPFPTVENLRNLGHDVVTLLELGKADQALPDDEVLKLATELKRAILTFNRKDFIKLHALNDQHSGIIVCKMDVNFSRLARNIDQSISKMSSLKRQLIRINRG